VQSRPYIKSAGSFRRFLGERVIRTHARDKGRSQVGARIFKCIVDNNINQAR